MFIRPREKLFKIPALMGNSHAVDSDFRHEFEGRVPIAHDSLTNVIEAVITMQYYLCWRHIGNAVRVVCKPEEILRRYFSREEMKVMSNSRGNAIDETWKYHRRRYLGLSPKEVWEEGRRWIFWELRLFHLQAVTASSTSHLYRLLEVRRNSNAAGK